LVRPELAFIPQLASCAVCSLNAHRAHHSRNRLPVDIKDEVKLVIANQLKIPVELIKPNVRLKDLGAESLDFVEVLFELEEKFDISIPFNANQPKAELGDESTLLTSTVDELADVIARIVTKKSEQ
jgi:acyl carrier protein